MSEFYIVKLDVDEVIHEPWSFNALFGYPAWLVQQWDDESITVSEKKYVLAESLEAEIAKLRDKCGQYRRQLGAANANKRKLVGRIERLEKTNGALCDEINRQSHEIYEKGGEVDATISAFAKLLDEYRVAAAELDKLTGGGMWCARAEAWEKVLDFMGKKEA